MGQADSRIVASELLNNIAPRLRIAASSFSGDQRKVLVEIATIIEDLAKLVNELTDTTINDVLKQLKFLIAADAHQSSVDAYKKSSNARLTTIKLEKMKAEGTRLHKEALAKLDEADNANEQGDAERADKLLQEAKIKQEQSGSIFDKALELKDAAAKLHKEAEQKHLLAAKKHREASGNQDDEQ